MDTNNKVVLFFFFTMFLTLFYSCWLTDVGVQEKETLTGNYKIIVDPEGMEAGYILALNDDIGGYDIIKEQCLAVYYDSTKIFVESLQNYDPSIHLYCMITNLDDKHPIYRIKALNKKDFYRKVKECSTCVAKHYTELSSP